MQHHRRGARVRIIGVGHRRLTRPARGIRWPLAHDVGLRAILDAVSDIEQEPGEPAVHELEGRVAPVAALMEILHERHPTPHRVADPHAVLRHDVPIVERMGHQHRATDPAREPQQVAVRPELVVVARHAILARRHLAVAVQAVADRAGLGIAAMDEVVEGVDVLSKVPTRVTHQSMGTVVVVVRRVRSDGHDRLEALDPGGGRRHRNRAVVGRADHADLAGAPRGPDLLRAVDGRVALRAAVQPVDHSLGRQPLRRAPHGGAAFRKARARSLGVHHREAARNPFRHQVVRDQGPVRLEGHRGVGVRRRHGSQFVSIIPVDFVPGCDTREIGARLVDHRHLQALGVGLALPGDIHVDPVALAVAIRIELGLDPQVLADPLGTIGKRGNDLGLAVDEQRTGVLAARVAATGEGREDQEQREGSGAQDRGTGTGHMPKCTARPVGRGPFSPRLPYNGP